jgi:hypothetical protein
MNDVRRDERAPVTGTLRLMVKSGVGYVLASGQIVDLSAGGCGVRVGHRELEADLKGRIEVTIAGQPFSLPVVTRWVRTEPDGSLIVGCRFFELNLREQRAIHQLIFESCASAIGLPASEASTS